MEQKVNLTVSGNVNARTGVYANMAQIRTSQKEAVLDFIFIDNEEVNENGEVSLSGVVQSRVIMSIESVLELRDALNSHLEQFVTEVK